MHHRVADDDDAVELWRTRGRFSGYRQKLRQHRAKLFADEPLQFQPAAVHREFDAAHHIAAVACLRIQRRLDGEHIAGLQIQQLRGNRGGA